MFEWSDIFSLSGQTLLYRLVAVAAVLGFHGWSLALCARLFGDSGPRHDGRLTINPLNHFDFFGALAALVFRFGWIRPLVLDTASLKGGRPAAIAVYAASLIALVVFAALLWQLRPLVTNMFPGASPAIAAVGIMEVTADLSIRFALLNIIPLPPLTGAILLATFAPDVYGRLTQRPLLPSVIMGVIVLLGVPDFVFGDAVKLVSGAIM